MHLCRYDDALKSLQTVSQTNGSNLSVLETPQKVSHPVLKLNFIRVQRYVQAQKLAIDQRRNFGEEIAQSIRTTKKKRWEDLENKRKQQEIELEDYLINLVKSKEGESEQVNTGHPRTDPIHNSFYGCYKCIRINNHQTNEQQSSRIRQIKELFAQVDERRQQREVPDYLCDKISFELLTDPVITPSGITYNKKGNYRFNPMLLF